MAWKKNLIKCHNKCKWFRENRTFNWVNEGWNNAAKISLTVKTYNVGIIIYTIIIITEKDEILPVIQKEMLWQQPVLGELSGKFNLLVKGKQPFVYKVCVCVCMCLQPAGFHLALLLAFIIKM